MMLLRPSGRGEDERCDHMGLDGVMNEVLVLLYDIRSQM